MRLWMFILEYVCVCVGGGVGVGGECISTSLGRNRRYLSSLIEFRFELAD